MFLFLVVVGRWAVGMGKRASDGFWGTSAVGKMLVNGLFDLAQWLVSCAVWVRVCSL